jgi:hypothetical protein
MNTLFEPELNDLESLAEIFNAYRVFYHQEPNIDLARKFIHERITQKDSKIFIKKDELNNILGFIQLYPTFSSVSAGKARNGSAGFMLFNFDINIGMFIYLL